MALKTRTDLVNEALANLGIIQQPDTATVRTRAELVAESLASLGIIYQTDASAARVRADLVTEILANLGVIYQADASATRTRAEWVTETLSIIGVIQQADAGATRTRSDLVNNIAYILGPGAIGQTLDADNYDAIDTRLPTIVADLNARIIVTVSNLAAIPAAWFDSLSLIAANTLKDKYGVTGDEAVKLAASALLAEKKLRTLSRTGLVDEILPSLIGDLNARGIATVANIAAIPGAWFASLADIAAEYCKGKFEIDAGRSQELAVRAKDAERKLKNITRSPLVDEKLPSLMGELNARGIANVTLTAIPGAWFSAIADIGAESIKGKFELSNERSQEIAVRAKVAEVTLKGLTRASFVDASLPSLMADLNARGVATVTLTAIPSAWLPSLSDIVADYVRPMCDVAPEIAKRVAEAAPRAERTLKNLTRTYIVDRNIDQILAELAVDEIVYLVDVSAIPDEWFISLAAIVANRCKGKGFDLDPGTINRVALEGHQAEATLRRITRGRPAYLPQQSSYF